MRQLPLILLGAAALLAVIAIVFAGQEPAYRWTNNETVFSPAGGSTTHVVTHAVTNEVAGRAAMGFALASGMSLIAAAVAARPVERT